MTRVNGSIDPVDLVDQHLIAEYREIVRIPGHVLKHNVNITRYKVPNEFVLGRGHVTFFFDKVKFLHERFLRIKDVMASRGIANAMDDQKFVDVLNKRPDLYNDCDIGNAGNALVSVRIAERVSEMKRQPTLSGDPVDREEYKELISKYSRF